jgi:hypothetical protein
VNATAAQAIVGVAAPPAATLVLPPAIHVVNVATGAVAATATQQTPDAVVSDPTNPGIAYVLEGQGSAGQIDRVNLTTTPPTDSMLVAAAAFAPNICCTLTSLAISPDGGTLFVGEEGDGFAGLGVVPVSNVGAAFEWNPRGRTAVNIDSIADLVVSPDGHRLYVAATGFSVSGREGDVFAFSLPIGSGSLPVWQQPLTSGTANPVLQLSMPTCITVSPDGSTLELGGNDGPGTLSVVQSVSSGGSPTEFQQVPMSTGPNGTLGLRSIAFTPDGTTLLVVGTDGGGSSDDAIIPLRASDLAVGPKTHLPVRSEQTVAQSLAITPDQAPAAAISSPSAVQVGHSITFDASASTVAYGSVSSFFWNFGDGGTTTTAIPTVSHSYAAPGTAVVTVTETDSAGTSVPPAVSGTGFAVDGPGQTPYRHADPSAQQSVSISVTTAPPPPTTGTSTPGTTGTTGPPGTTTTGTTGPGQTTSPTTGKGQHPSGAPILVLNPTVGPPGTIVTVSGSGFRPNTAVTVTWSVSTGSVVITADRNGNLPPSPLLILTPDVLGPRLAVASSTPQATAPFLVVPATSEPGGDDAGLLFRSEGP